MLNVDIYKNLFDMTVDVSFEFGRGILVLSGPSGAGKTTVLNCVAGLQNPDRGCISLDGRVFFSSADGIAVQARNRKIGYVFQDYALFPHMTAKKNILYGIPVRCRHDACRRVSAVDVLEMLKIVHLQDRYPSQLSGGEKQRVALARALMVEPDLLLLDEPLSALDHDNRKSLQEDLRQLQRIWRIPFVLVTHSRREMHRLADEILFIDHGKRKTHVFPAKRSPGLCLES